MKDVWNFQNAWVFKIHFSFWCFANFSFISVFVVSIYVSASMFSKLKNTDNWKFYFRKSVHATNFWYWTRKQRGCPISGTTFYFLGWRKYRFSESFLRVYIYSNRSKYILDQDVVTEAIVNYNLLIASLKGSFVFIYKLMPCPPPHFIDVTIIWDHVTTPILAKRI